LPAGTNDPSAGPAATGTGSVWELKNEISLLGSRLRVAGVWKMATMVVDEVIMGAMLSDQKQRNSSIDYEWGIWITCLSFEISSRIQG